MTITSKEVAEMLGKRHDNLLRAIRKYITQLGDEAPKYFSEDPDKGGRLYHITSSTGLSGVVWIDADTHTWQNGVATMSLTVARWGKLER